MDIVVSCFWTQNFDFIRKSARAPKTCRLHSGAIVFRIDTFVVGRPVDFYPIGAVDSPPIVRRRAPWKSTGYLDPPTLLLGDCPNLSRGLRQILILTEHNSHLIGPVHCPAEDVQRNADIDTLFLPG